DLALCFEGAVPAVIATASADGTPNVTYLSRLRIVDDERVALSNQFLSKTATNLAENPQASVLVLDPTSYDEFRMALVYERTDRRGPLFDRLREDVDATAALSGMQHVFKLRAADIYRVVDIERVPTMGDRSYRSPRSTRPAPEVASVAALTARLSRCVALDTLVSATVRGLAELLGYGHATISLLDEDGERLYTIASHGYASQGVGSEVRLGESTIGLAGLRCAPVRIGSLTQMGKYAASVRRSFEDRGSLVTGPSVPLPVLADAESQLAVPMMALGQLVGVLALESAEPVAFSDADEAALSVVAAVVAHAIEAARAEERVDDPTVPEPTPAVEVPNAAGDATQIRFFGADGSVFVGSEYLIKGVAGRILWSLLRQHERDGRTEFTNKEVRLDPTLELPEYRDNLESRLILLKRRLDERDVPVRIEKTGRGRFRLVVSAPLRLGEPTA
ncbi:MAG TPA: GAF domain-containing protein, partial [Acidimicrobiales bacterium]|nr:GAF domain-containing protein [Acidimicrobiales bacterium]